MGTPMFSVPILKSLYQNGYPVTCVYTQPPQRSKRGQKVNKSPIQGISETLNIEFRAPETLKDNQEEYEFIIAYDPTEKGNFFYIGDYSKYGDYLNLNVYSEHDHEKRQYEMEVGK